MPAQSSVRWSCVIALAFAELITMSTEATPQAQQKASSQKLEFEVASVRPSARDSRERGWEFLHQASSIEPRSGLFSANAGFLSYLIFAYDLIDPHTWWSPDKTLPLWVKMNNWDIEARSEEVPSRAQLKLKIQSLLKERFKLVVHFENQQMPVYAIRLAKPGQLGPMLKPQTSRNSCSNSTDETPSSGESQAGRGNNDMLYCLGKIWNDHGQTHIAISDVSMDQVTGFISANTMSERRMVNQTGLDGRYDIHVVYPLQMQLQGEDMLEYMKVDAARRRKAFEKQLGLKFVPTTAEVPVLMVDHIERPSPN